MICILLKSSNYLNAEDAEDWLRSHLLRGLEDRRNIVEVGLDKLAAFARELLCRSRLCITSDCEDGELRGLWGGEEGIDDSTALLASGTCDEDDFGHGLERHG